MPALCPPLAPPPQRIIVRHTHTTPTSSAMWGPAPAGTPPSTRASVGERAPAVSAQTGATRGRGAGAPEVRRGLLCRLKNTNAEWLSNGIAAVPPPGRRMRPRVQPFDPPPPMGVLLWDAVIAHHVARGRKGKHCHRGAARFSGICPAELGAASARSPCAGPGVAGPEAVARSLPSPAACGGGGGGSRCCALPHAGGVLCACCGGVGGGSTRARPRRRGRIVSDGPVASCPALPCRALPCPAVPRRIASGRTATPPPPKGCIRRGEPPPPTPPGRPAYDQPLSSQVPASMAFVTDSNRPQPLWQPPPTACPNRL